MSALRAHLTSSTGAQSTLDTIKAFQGIRVEKHLFSHFTFVTEEQAQRHNAKWGHKYPMTASSLGGSIRPWEVDTGILSGQIEILKRDYSDRTIFSPFTDTLEDLDIYYKDPDRFIMGN